MNPRFSEEKIDDDNMKNNVPTLKTLPFSEPIHELDESLKMHRFAMDHAPDPIF